MTHEHYFKRSEAYNKIGEDEWFSLDKRCMTYRVYNTNEDEKGEEQPFTIIRCLHYILDDID